MKSFAQRSIAPVSVALAIMAALVVTLVIIGHALIPTLSSMAKLASNPTSILRVLSHGKMVDVAIYDGTNRVDRHVPALDGTSIGYSAGYGTSFPGQNTNVQVEEKYKVTSDSPGHFQVTMHRVVQRDGVTTISDVTMPVWKTEPGNDKRIKLQDGSTVAAFLSTNSPH